MKYITLPCVSRVKNRSQDDTEIEDKSGVKEMSKAVAIEKEAKRVFFFFVVFLNFFFLTPKKKN